MNLTPLHVGISVKDMDEALDWYQKNLGFQLVKDDGFLPPLGARVCFLQHGSFQIELFEYQAPKPLPPDRLHPNLDLQTIGTKHIGLRRTGPRSSERGLMRQWGGDCPRDHHGAGPHSVYPGLLRHTD